MSVWSGPAETLAQQAVPAALDMTEHSTLWSLEGAGSNKTPYLVLGMADRGDTPSYDLLWTAGNKATTPSAENTITRQGGLAASVNRSEKVEPDPLVLSSLLDRTLGLRFSECSCETYSTRILSIRIPVELYFVGTTLSE
jgi:hypothetical protein